VLPAPAEGTIVPPPSASFPSLLTISCQVCAKFGTCTVVGLNGTLVEGRMYAFYLQQVSHLDPRGR
jgi:hypothetical protein